MSSSRASSIAPFTCASSTTPSSRSYLLVYSEKVQAPQSKGLTCADIPVRSVYEAFVVQDIWQLENGIRVDNHNYIGTIHFIAGDHVELCALAGIRTGTSCNFA